jgi:hypothetical protein
VSFVCSSVSSFFWFSAAHALSFADPLFLSPEVGVLVLTVWVLVVAVAKLTGAVVVLTGAVLVLTGAVLVLKLGTSLGASANDASKVQDAKWVMAQAHSHELKLKLIVVTDTQFDLHVLAP